MDLKGLKFSKMHGIGNDFPIIDESAGEVIPEAAQLPPSSANGAT